MLLVAPEGMPVVVSPLVDEIWERLVAGVSVTALAAELQRRRPRARDVGAKLAPFLNRLWSAGLLEGSGTSVRPSARRLELQVDPLARACASVLARLPRRLLAALILGVVAASLGSLLALLASGRHPRIRQLPDHLTIAGVLTIVLVLMPLHELGHAVACRTVGVPSGPAGIRLGVLRIPRPYVATPLGWSIENATRRCWIPAGGPLVDLLVGGLAAGALMRCHPASAVGDVLWLVSLYALIAVVVGTSPVPVGDGSHLLEALLDDEFARSAALLGRQSRFVRPRSVPIYRLTCLGHVIVSGWLIHLLR